MKHYGMRWLDVLALPMPMFWLLTASVGRLAAETDLRSMSVQMFAAAGGEDVKGYQQRLVIEMNGKAATEQEIVEAKAEMAMEETLDRAGLNLLRSM